MKKKIVVIGSGFGGLGAANRLAANGHEVHLYEKRDKLGGRAYQYEINGFKFDGGPTVITAPYIFDEIFNAAGKNRDDYFKLVPFLTKEIRRKEETTRRHRFWNMLKNGIQLIKRVIRNLKIRQKRFLNFFTLIQISHFLSSAV